MNEIDIDGILTQSFQVKKYKYFVSYLEPHKSVSLVICLFDASNNEVYRMGRLIEGEEYNNWGLHDNYLDKIVEEEVNKVLKKEGS
jgi:hypothetical protein